MNWIKRIFYLMLGFLCFGPITVFGLFNWTYYAVKELIYRDSTLVQNNRFEVIMFKAGYYFVKKLDEYWS